jgi:hypothetical protein
MPDRKQKNSNRDHSPAPAAQTWSTPRGSRRQLATASILLAVWIVFLVVMAIYS